MAGVAAKGLVPAGAKGARAARLLPRWRALPGAGAGAGAAGPGPPVRAGLGPAHSP